MCELSSDDATDPCAAMHFVNISTARSYSPFWKHLFPTPLSFRHSSSLDSSALVFVAVAAVAVAAATAEADDGDRADHRSEVRRMDGKARGRGVGSRV